MSTAYFVLIREMRDAYNHRLRLVQSARQRGIKPTARLFQTTVPTVRKWLRRYQQHGPRGLIELSRAPHHPPGKTPAAVEQQVVALRQQLFTFGARRLIREFDLPLSHRALERIWRQHGLLKKRQRKYQRKQDLAHIKATWRVFQQISADTKDLNDIPRYWPQAQAFDLPAVEYTAREVRSRVPQVRAPVFGANLGEKIFFPLLRFTDGSCPSRFDFNHSVPAEKPGDTVEDSDRTANRTSGALPEPIN